MAAGVTRSCIVAIRMTHLPSLPGLRRPFVATAAIISLILYINQGQKTKK
jgi:hypothetical protein